MSVKQIWKDGISGSQYTCFGSYYGGEQGFILYANELEANELSRINFTLPRTTMILPANQNIGDT